MCLQSKQPPPVSASSPREGLQRVESESRADLRLQAVRLGDLHAAVSRQALEIHHPIAKRNVAVKTPVRLTASARFERRQSFPLQHSPIAVALGAGQWPT